MLPMSCVGDVLSFNFSIVIELSLNTWSNNKEKAKHIPPPVQNLQIGYSRWENQFKCSLKCEAIIWLLGICFITTINWPINAFCCRGERIYSSSSLMLNQSMGDWLFPTAQYNYLPLLLTEWIFPQHTKQYASYMVIYHCTIEVSWYISN